MKEIRKKASCLFLYMILIISLTACKKTESVVKSESVDITNFSLESYKNQIVDERKALNGYRSESVEDEFEKVENTNLDFSECKFSEFPDITDVSVFSNSYRGMTEQEALNLIKTWLKSIGKSDLENLDQQIFVVSESYEPDDTKEYPYCYHTISEQTPNFSAGDAIFFDTVDCSITVDSNGIQSVSDGKIARYLNREYAYADINHENYEVEESGTLDEIGYKEYSLIGGKLSVADGADLATKYFSQESLFPSQDGMKMEVAEVRVIRLNDVFGYDYLMRRVYNEVPFAYWDTGYFLVDQGYMPKGDIIHAFVVDDTGVSAFWVGTSPCAMLTPLYTDDKIISFDSAVKILDEKLAKQLSIKIDTVDFVYMPFSFSESEKLTDIVSFPCWEFKGINTRKNEKICIYVDALTGDVRYYTMQNDE